MTQSPWRLEGRTATLALGPLRARVDLDRPEIGLTDLSFAGGSHIPAQILGLELPTDGEGRDRFVDAHVRGNDLIANYGESTRPSLRWQIYWRACSARFPAALAAIEAIVSVQTGLLDSVPKVTLRSTFPVTCAFQGEAGSTGQFGLAGVDLFSGKGAYLELVHPDDFQGSQATGPVDTADGLILRHFLFDDQLEKGVILRSRVLALFLPERPAAEAIAVLKQTFADEALPLTT